MNTSEAHPSAVEHMPFFITGPGHTDVLLVIVAAFLLLSVLGIGLLFWRLHALPEHLAHRGQKLQYELVAVLALISLFTHEHIFWIAGLLLAFVDLPDFTSPLNRIAASLERFSSSRPPTGSSLAQISQSDAKQAGLIEGEVGTVRHSDEPRRTDRSTLDA